MESISKPLDRMGSGRLQVSIEKRSDLKRGSETERSWTKESCPADETKEAELVRWRTLGELCPGIQGSQ